MKRKGAAALGEDHLEAPHENTSKQSMYVTYLWHSMVAYKHFSEHDQNTSRYSISG